MLVAASMEGGLVEGAQQEVVERAFDMTDLRVRAIMTPRREVVWADADAGEDAYGGYPVVDIGGMRIDKVIASRLG